MVHVFHRKIGSPSAFESQDTCTSMLILHQKNEHMEHLQRGTRTKKDIGGLDCSNWNKGSAGPAMCLLVVDCFVLDFC